MMNTRIKKILASLMLTLLCIGFTSCNDNDEPDLPYVYLDYRIEKLESGVVNAFANFTTSPVGGQRVKLPSKASITVNGLGMTYYASDANVSNTFDYSANITRKVSDGNVTFLFKHSNGKSTSTNFDLNTLPDFSIPRSYTTIRNGVRYPLFEEEDAKTGINYVVQLVSHDNKIYEALSGINGEFSFSGITPGSYTLRYIQSTTQQIPETDGTFGGLLQVWNVKSIAGIRVENVQE